MMFRKPAIKKKECRVSGQLIHFKEAEQMKKIVAAAAAIVLAVSIAVPASADEVKKTVIVYDDFDSPGYSMTDYLAKWSNIYGPGEMAVKETRSFAGGRLSIDAAPFQTGYDYSVYDHLKYLAVSNTVFAVPKKGSITFSMDLTVETPGTFPEGRTYVGTYGPSYSYPNGAPYSAVALEAQQASASLHMIDFSTGQLFDWLVAGHKAVTLIERLPSTVTGNTTDANSPDYVGRGKMYTQIIEEVPITAGQHRYAITYTRDEDGSRVEYFLDGKRVSKVKNVGVPLDVQGMKYSGIYPSLGPGELLKDKINSVAIAHGLISLMDAFPFQHPEAPELSVSVPLSERLFGQGARASYDNFIVTIEER